MAAPHPVLPQHRPLAIAHRGGNSPAEIERALALGVDMLEVDIWPFHGRLEVRHAKSLGPVPIYWEKWYITSWFGKQFQLKHLLAATPAATRLFLDLKGTLPRLGERVVRAVRRQQPDREIVLCGRDWRQLDRVAHLPFVHVFYSVGTDDELARVWPTLESAPTRAISINYVLLTDEVLNRLDNLGTTIIAWTVNDPEMARTLMAKGVDGFTSDNPALLDRIVRCRERAFDVHDSSPPPAEAQRKVTE